MSCECNCSSSCDLILDLQPLRFEDKSTSADVLIYQAEIRRPLAPGSPVFSLTLSTSLKEGGLEAKNEIDFLKKELRADFLLTAPWPDDEPVIEPSHDQGCDCLEIVIVPRLVSKTIDGAFDVFFAAEAPIGHPRVVLMGNGSFRKGGRHHTWTAPDGNAHGHVTMKQGRAYVTYSNEQSPDISFPGPPDSWPVHGHTITVHSRSYCRYHVAGSYHS